MTKHRWFTYRSWQHQHASQILQYWSRKLLWPWSWLRASSCHLEGRLCLVCCRNNQRRTKCPANTLSNTTPNTNDALLYTTFMKKQLAGRPLLRTNTIAYY